MITYVFARFNCTPDPIRWEAGLLVEATAGAAGAFAVCGLATFLLAVDANRLGMPRLPCVRGRRDHHDESSDGETDASLLRRVGGIGGLVGRGIGHHERRTIGKLGVSTFPEMLWLHQPLCLSGDVGRELMKSRFGKLALYLARVVTAQ